MRTQNLHLRFVLITLGILFLEAVVNAMFSLGALPFAATLMVMYVTYFVYGARVKDHSIWIWLLFGFVTGMVNVTLDCDRYLVEDQKVFVYADDLRKIGVTPAYVRFAWGLIFTQLGLLGWWFRRRRASMVEASILIAVVGGVMISVFENLARQAGWWYYRNTPMLIWTPYFVNLFEFVITLVIVPVGWWVAKQSPKRAYIWAVVLGVAMGVWMCVAMRITYYLLGPCQGAVFQLPCEPRSLPPVWGPLG